LTLWNYYGVSQQHNILPPFNFSPNDTLPFILLFLYTNSTCFLHTHYIFLTFSFTVSSPNILILQTSTTTIHESFGLPLPLTPSTHPFNTCVAIRSSSILSTWPNHLNKLFSYSLIILSFTHYSFLTQVFITLSRLVLPHILWRTNSIQFTFMLILIYPRLWFLHKCWH
jgi:hypothetical protein